jgi:hypothetical protein
MRIWKGVLVAAAVLAVANVASAAPIVYSATIVIDWYNGYTGNGSNTDNNASVTVDYTGGGNFTITSVTYSSNTAWGPMNLGAAGTTTGTISGGTASGTMGYSGSIPGAGQSVSNTNGSYSGSVSGSGFLSGDVYALTSPNAGTMSPGVGGSSNWDHRINDGGTPGNGGTRIIFGTPEPATMLLLAGGALFLRRRR